MFFSLKAFLITLSRSTYLRNLVMIMRGRLPFLPILWTCWNSISPALSIPSCFDKNSTNTALVPSCSSLPSGMPANFRFSHLLYASRYKIFFPKSSFASLRAESASLYDFNSRVSDLPCATSRLSLLHQPNAVQCSSACFSFDDLRSQLSDDIVFSISVSLDQNLSIFSSMLSSLLIFLSISSSTSSFVSFMEIRSIFSANLSISSDF